MNYPYYNPNGQVGAPQINQPNSNLNTPINNNGFNYNTQQNMFPQPTGNVYSLMTASDIGNVPAGLGISVGLCLQENLMYIKSLQNGSPVLLGYRLVPLEGVTNGVISDTSSTDCSTNELLKENKRLMEVIRSHDDKIHMLEEQLVKLKDKIGGKTEWQI